ncbi:MAG: hypothetical protein A4E26_00611 [Methanobacterium sp. PtaU1.Bin097]|nr:MAG: hypothetical protein A4E26_00611 [Methanobacterium sp. PtaU1.Bin097]
MAPWVVVNNIGCCRLQVVIRDVVVIRIPHGHGSTSRTDQGIMGDGVVAGPSHGHGENTATVGQLDTVIEDIVIVGTG